MKWNEFYKIAAFLAILFFFSTSCKEDDPNLPDYVGTWSAVDSILIGDKMTPRMKVITLTETTFFFALQVEMPEIVIPKGEIPQDVWTDLIGVKGTISFNGNVFNRIITEIGIYFIRVEEGLPKNAWEIYKDHQEEFEPLLLEWGLTKTIESQYSILGLELTLQTDLNIDGDYEDENEIIVYKKET